MPDVSLHLIPFLEIVGAVVAVPMVAFHVWRGWRRRRAADASRHDARPERGR